MLATGENPGTLPPDSPEAREYARRKRWLTVADTVLGLLTLALLLLTGLSLKMRDLAWKASGENFNLALFFYVVLLASVVKVVSLALDLQSFRLEHRYHLATQTLRSWLWDETKGWALAVVLGWLLAAVVYWTMRSDPEWWWVMAWAIFLVLFVLLAQLAPVLLFPIFYKFVPLEDEALKERLLRLSEKAGTRVRGIYEWKLSEKSKKANAALTGLGHTRRILLADTLLTDYSHDEIEAVLAHELGHHVHRHILKGLLVEAVIALIGFAAAGWALGLAVQLMPQLIGIHDFADMPLLLLVAGALSLLLAPFLNAYSRHNERQADDYCWRSIPSVGPYVSAMEKLSRQNLAEQNPSRWVEILFHSHPPIARRIAAAKAFRRGPAA